MGLKKVVNIATGKTLVKRSNNRMTMWATLECTLDCGHVRVVKNIDYPMSPSKLKCKKCEEV